MCECGSQGEQHRANRNEVFAAGIIVNTDRSSEIDR
ncbi:Uncharacterised protein [Yersinia intermedia]|nr:Uncharacterised protein [Yersinia intermedia]